MEWKLQPLPAGDVVYGPVIQEASDYAEAVTVDHLGMTCVWHAYLDPDETSSWYEQTHGDATGTLRRALLAERRRADEMRERCAKVAADGAGHPGDQRAPLDVALDIAAAIRKL